MSTEDEVCSVCGGSGVTKAVIHDMNEAEKNGGLEPRPIECQLGRNHSKNCREK